MKKMLTIGLMVFALVSIGTVSFTAYSQEAAVEPVVKCEVDEIPVDHDHDGDIDFCVQCNFAKCTPDEQEVVDPWGCVRACRPIIIKK